MNATFATARPGDYDSPNRSSPKAARKQETAFAANVAPLEEENNGLRTAAFDKERDRLVKAGILSKGLAGFAAALKLAGEPSPARGSLTAEQNLGTALARAARGIASRREA